MLVSFVLTPVITTYLKCIVTLLVLSDIITLLRSWNVDKSRSNGAINMIRSDNPTGFTQANSLPFY